MIRSFVLTAVVASLAALGGCGKQNGDQFIGKFENQAQKATVEVSRNGDSFLITNTHPSQFSDGMRTDKLPATYHDGVLQVAAGFGGTANIGYDKEHDTLLMPTIGGSSVEFPRVK